MTSNVTCKLMGGLGNYIFQIATAYAYSLRHNKNFVIDISDIMTVHKPIHNYTSNIFRKINFVNNPSPKQIFNQSGHHYEKIPYFQDDIKLVGHFQSEKYFMDFSEEIKKLFEIDDVTHNYLIEKYGEKLKNNNCSIHVRRGDYLKFPNHHPVVNKEYFLQITQTMDENTNYFIFSDDIPWCKENFDFLKNKSFIEDNLDFQDLYLMSFCNNNIIANSSFSWWAAWLNENKNKKVFAPKKWFGPAYSHFIIKDTYPENWTLI